MPSPRASSFQSRAEATRKYDRQLRIERLEARRHDVEIQWGKVGAPARHAQQAWRFRDPEYWTDARDRIVRRLGSGFLLALIGNRGPGKTQLAVDTCRAAIEMYKTARYIKAINLMTELRRAHNECDESVVQRHLKCSLLVVDAIEVRTETGFGDQMFTHLVDVRYDGMVDTLLVCNLLPDEFEAAIGTSVASRIHETGDVIECDWESFR